MPHIYVGKLGHHCFRYWFVICSVPSHYLNQRWPIVNWTIRNEFQWNLNLNSSIFIQEYAFENVVCQKLRPSCPVGDELNRHRTKIYWSVPYLVILSCRKSSRWYSKLDLWKKIHVPGINLVAIGIYGHRKRFSWEKWIYKYGNILHHILACRLVPYPWNCCSLLRSHPADTLRNNDVFITSKRCHFGVITSKWRRFDVITTLLLRHVFSGQQFANNG